MRTSDGSAADTFAYRARKDGSVSITWNGRDATVLRGGAAERFLARVQAMEPAQVQLEMARVTGNFKRGNEDLARTKERRKGQPGCDSELAKECDPAAPHADEHP